MEHATDATLVRRYLAGEAAAFDALLARHATPIHSYILRLVGNRDSAQDVFQDCMLRVIRYLPKRYSEQGTFRSWLYRVAHHAAMDHLRRRKPVVSLDAPSGGDDTHPAPGDLLTDAGPSPFQALAEQRDWERIERAARSLTPSQQEVFWMRVTGELSFAEIAQALECPLNTALGRMHDALKKIRAVMEQEARETDAYDAR